MANGRNGGKKSGNGKKSNDNGFVSVQEILKTKEFQDMLDKMWERQLERNASLREEQNAAFRKEMEGLRREVRDWVAMNFVTRH